MIPPGPLVRRLLGKHFHLLGEPYRRIFVDMPKVVHCMLLHIPPSARILDVGGGDGYVADLILSHRPDVTAAIIDVSDDVGSYVKPQNRQRVEFHPATDVSHVTGTFDIITLSDVLHHVPEAVRDGFLNAIVEMAERVGCQTIVVKDIEPGGLRAKLALWADLYITGDKSVSQVSQDSITFPGFQRIVADMPDFPNYCLVFKRPIIAS